MARINQNSLMSLEAYAKARPEFRKQAIAHKARRKIFVGDHVMLQFEDEITVRYQIQEMLRIEKTFEEEGIQDELDAYTPLLPDGSNWKATQAIEYSDVEERKLKLVELKGLERHTYIQVGTQDRVYAIADEDLPRENDEKTSAIHFLRFELDAGMVAAAKAGEPIAVGVDLPAYNIHVLEIAPETQTSLVDDLK